MSLSLPPSPPTSAGEAVRRRPTRFGPYLVTDELGRGGMGAVYRVRHEGTGADYALKVLRTDVGAIEEEDVARFRREGELLARLSGHPGIVRVHSSGFEAGSFYIVMELVAGESLAAMLDCGPVEPREAARLVAETARAVHHAHGAGVLHRDLKPPNIIVDPSGQPRVLDFGLAKDPEQSPLTKTNEILGTPSYMAPEQIEPGPDGAVRAVPATDVYGLGGILYALLTGTPPFVASRHIQLVLYDVLTKDPLRPRKLRPTIPVELEVICLRALEKDAARRYPSAAALADDLDRFLRGSAIEARPVGAVERAGRRLRRRMRRAPRWVPVLVVLAFLSIPALMFDWVGLTGPSTPPIPEPTTILRLLEAKVAARGKLTTSELDELANVAESAPGDAPLQLRIAVVRAFARRIGGDELGAALRAPGVSDELRQVVVEQIDDQYRQTKRWGELARILHGGSRSLAPAEGALRLARECARSDEVLPLEVVTRVIDSALAAPEIVDRDYELIAPLVGSTVVRIVALDTERAFELTNRFTEMSGCVEEIHPEIVWATHAAADAFRSGRFGDPAWEPAFRNVAFLERYGLVLKDQENFEDAIERIPREWVDDRAALELSRSRPERAVIVLLARIAWSRRLSDRSWLDGIESWYAPLLADPDVERWVLFKASNHLSGVARKAALLERAIEIEKLRADRPWPVMRSRLGGNRLKLLGEGAPSALREAARSIEEALRLALEIQMDRLEPVAAGIEWTRLIPRQLATQGEIINSTIDAIRRLLDVKPECCDADGQLVENLLQGAIKLLMNWKPERIDPTNPSRRARILSRLQAEHDGVH